MNLYSVMFTEAATSEWKILRLAGDTSKITRIEAMIKWIAQAPLSDQLPFVILPDPLNGVVARRIDLQTIILYEVLNETRRIKVLSIATNLPVT